MTFSEMLSASGLTQRELSKATGISGTTCQRLLRGQAELSTAMRQRIMPVLEAAQRAQQQMLKPFYEGDLALEEERRVTALYGCGTSW